MRKLISGIAGLTLLLLGAFRPEDSAIAPYPPLIAQLVKPQSAENRVRLVSDIRALVSKESSVTAAQFAELEKLIRKGTAYPAADPGSTASFKVPVRTKKEFPVYVYVPKNYDPAKATPLLVVMHGGPLDALSMAHQHAKMMLSGWKSHADRAGWLMLATVEGTNTTGELTGASLAEIIDAVKERYHVDPNAVYLTGHSRGGFFSWGYGLADPDRFAGIAPDCGGKFYEDGLLNAALLPVYNMQGRKDNQGNQNFILPKMAKQNRDKLDELRKKHAGFFEHLYRESDLGHTQNVSFYSDVVQWLTPHRRNLYSPKILGHVKRLGKDNRLYWFQLLDGQDEAIEVTCDRNANEVTVACEGIKKYRIFAHDALLDLDKPVKIYTNGKLSYEGMIKRSPVFLLQHVAETNDLGRFYANGVEINAK